MKDEWSARRLTFSVLKGKYLLNKMVGEMGGGKGAKWMDRQNRGRVMEGHSDRTGEMSFCGQMWRKEWRFFLKI